MAAHYYPLAADAKGRIFPLCGYGPAGMKAGHFFALTRRDFIPLPKASLLFRLPGRRPIVVDLSDGRYVEPERAALYPVAAFVAPGCTLTYNAAYRERASHRELPLYTYGAVAQAGEKLYVAAIRVDSDRRHDLTGVEDARLLRALQAVRRLFPGNRLIGQLVTCALRYGCPNAQNFFLGWFEAPLPVSPSCNARCAGCISAAASCRHDRSRQSRITFVPSPEEIAEAALFHIGRAKDPIVSFGQGCEGEPLLAAPVVLKAIRLIRKSTSRGSIHMNTNGSRPALLARCVGAGLGSVRISLNSARELYYNRYYAPRGYSFRDVLCSIDVAGRGRAFVALNYLTMPGFTDSQDEVSALIDLLERHKVSMVQWRNLNIDPLAYGRCLKAASERVEMIGVEAVIAWVRERFPALRIGYFNPLPSQVKRGK